VKHVKDSTPAEAAATLAALKRGQLPEPPPPADGPKKAKEMSEQERAEWLRDYLKRLA
jgi:hypothetical protein